MNCWHFFFCSFFPPFRDNPLAVEAIVPLLEMGVSAEEVLGIIDNALNEVRWLSVDNLRLFNSFSKAAKNRSRLKGRTASHVARLFITKHGLVARLADASASTPRRRRSLCFCFPSGSVTCTVVLFLFAFVVVDGDSLGFVLDDALWCCGPRACACRWRCLVIRARRRLMVLVLVLVPVLVYLLTRAS